VLEEVTRPGFLEKTAQTGAYLQKRLEEFSQLQGGGEVRGKGLLWALDMGKETGPQVVEECLNRGLLINAPRKNTLRFMPALTVTQEEIDRMIGILKEVFQVIR